MKAELRQQQLCGGGYQQNTAQDSKDGARLLGEAAADEVGGCMYFGSMIKWWAGEQGTLTSLDCFVATSSRLVFHVEGAGRASQVTPRKCFPAHTR